MQLQQIQNNTDMNKCIYLFIISFLFIIGGQAQNTSKKPVSPQKKPTTQKQPSKGKASATASKTKQEPPKPKLLEFPNNCNDCLFAVELFPDSLYGPIADPKGGGFIMEITRDSKNSELFEIEHNTAWFTFKVTYNSKLLLDIFPENPNDDYDFLLYKATDAYICNKILNKRVKPVLSNLSAPNPDTKGAIGVSLKGDKKIISKKSLDAYTSTIDLKRDEVYYLVIDKINSNLGSYKLRLGYHIDGTRQTLTVIDDKTRKPVQADVLLVEKNSNNGVAINRKNVSSTPIVMVPNMTYSLYVQKNGYFSHFEEINSNNRLTDTAIIVPITQITKGAKFRMSEVYFTEGYTELMPESASALNPVLEMLSNYQGIKIDIKGYYYSYGVNPEEDVEISKLRAESVKHYYADLGIDPSRMTTSGMTKKEVQTIANEVLSKNKSFSDVKIEVTITDTGVETPKTTTKTNNK